MKAVLLDLDGTLYTEGVAIPGAAEAVAALRRGGWGVGFVTNTTSRSRRHLHERLTRIGVEAAAEEILTALRAGAAHLLARGLRRIAPLVPEGAFEDLAEFEISDQRPEAVVVGDLHERWNFETLNRAFCHLMDGAELVALSRDRYWQKTEGLVLDCGPFVAALEYATGKQAALCGKPSPEFFRAALGVLGDWALAEPRQVLMVGDDVWGDVEGAQRSGLTTCLVRTGKFRPEVFERSGVRPDHIIASVAELPALLA